MYGSCSRPCDSRAHRNVTAPVKMYLVLVGSATPEGKRLCRRPVVRTADLKVLWSCRVFHVNLSPASQEMHSQTIFRNTLLRCQFVHAWPDDHSKRTEQFLALSVLPQSMATLLSEQCGHATTSFRCKRNYVRIVQESVYLCSTAWAVMIVDSNCSALQPAGASTHHARMHSPRWQLAIY